MIRSLFGGKGKIAAPVMAARSNAQPSAPAHEPERQAPPPVPQPLFVDAASLDIILAEYRPMPFPAGLSSENGGFLLLADGHHVVCLRRQDMANTGVGYACARKLKALMPHVQIVDVSAAKMREAEQRGDAAASSGRRQQSSSTVQQQGFELVEAALKVDASDVHIDIEDKGPAAPLVVVTLRVNGEILEHARYTDAGSVQVFQEVNRAYYQNEATVLAGERNASVMNEAAGRFFAKLRLPLRDAEVRFESDTTSTGTTTTLRILNYEGKPSLITDLSSLGFAPSQSMLLTQAAQARFGLMLFMGATGDGKTTSVAAALAATSGTRKRRIGMEQPPELHIPYMQQLQFPEDDFRDAMKGTLRQDPDVIYVGEINGDEVARLAVSAALTGHLVPASLHANNVHSGLRRLVSDKGFAVSLEDLCSEGMLQLAEAQQLAPVLCTYCRVPATPHLHRDQISALEALQLDPLQMFARHPAHNNRCPHCHGRGVVSRTVLAEVVRPNTEFVEALRTEGVSAAMHVYRASRVAGFDQEDMTGKSVFEHGLYKAHVGMICTRQLLSDFDVLTHPEVLRKRARADMDRALRRGGATVESAE